MHLHWSTMLVRLYLQALMSVMLDAQLSMPGAQEDILRCIYSISDNNSYLLFNRDPVDRMIGYLRHFFRPDAAEPSASLAISGGLGGARLTHSHERQYHYVLQSLTLWREISHEVRCFPAFAPSFPARWYLRCSERPAEPHDPARDQP